MAVAVTLAVPALVCPAPAFDPDAALARGTTIFGLQVGGGVVDNHISNGHTSNPNRGFNSDTGIGGVSFYFK